MVEPIIGQRWLSTFTILVKLCVFGEGGTISEMHMKDVDNTQTQWP